MKWFRGSFTGSDASSDGSTVRLDWDGIITLQADTMAGAQAAMDEQLTKTFPPSEGHEQPNYLLYEVRILTAAESLEHALEQMMLPRLSTDTKES